MPRSKLIVALTRPSLRVMRGADHSQPPMFRGRVAWAGGWHSIERGSSCSPPHIQPTPALPGNSVAPRAVTCQSSWGFLNESNIQAHIFNREPGATALARWSHVFLHLHPIAPQYAGCLIHTGETSLFRLVSPGLSALSSPSAPCQARPSPP